MLDPSLAGGALAWSVRRRARHAGVAADPTEAHRRSSCAGGRGAGEVARRLGVGRRGARTCVHALLCGSGDVRAGRRGSRTSGTGGGTVGGAFGALHRLERMLDDIDGVASVGRWRSCVAENLMGAREPAARPTPRRSRAGGGRAGGKWLQVGAWFGRPARRRPGRQVRVAWAKRTRRSWRSRACTTQMRWSRWPRGARSRGLRSRADRPRLRVVEVLERGDISFFWKPSVRAADALPGEEPARVQSFFLVLSSGNKHRRVRVGKKRLPVRAGERLWARRAAGRWRG